MEHRFTNKKGIELIKKFEGFRAIPYICPGGHLTIGYGHKFLENEQFNNISVKTAEQILIKDLYTIEKVIIKSVSIELNDNQFAALVSFVFNVGAGAFQRSNLRKKVNLGFFTEIEEEFFKMDIYKENKITRLIS